MWRVRIIVGTIIVAMGQVQAHDIFTGLEDPVTHLGCCNGPDSVTPDCQRVPPEMMKAGVITEVPNGYQVVLTLEQAQYFNKMATMPVNEFVPWERVGPGLATGFALCIYNNAVRCMIGPSNT